jgi:hypothetical protein
MSKHLPLSRLLSRNYDVESEQKMPFHKGWHFLFQMGIFLPLGHKYVIPEAFLIGNPCSR